MPDAVHGRSVWDVYASQRPPRREPRHTAQIASHQQVLLFTGPARRRPASKRASHRADTPCNSRHRTMPQTQRERLCSPSARAAVGRGKTKKTHMMTVSNHRPSHAMVDRRRAIPPSPGPSSPAFLAGSRPSPPGTLDTSMSATPPSVTASEKTSCMSVRCGFVGATPSRRSANATICQLSLSRAMTACEPRACQNIEDARPYIQGGKGIVVVKTEYSRR